MARDVKGARHDCKNKATWLRKKGRKKGRKKERERGETTAFERAWERSSAQSVYTIRCVYVSAVTRVFSGASIYNWERRARSRTHALPRAHEIRETSCDMYYNVYFPPHPPPSRSLSYFLSLFRVSYSCAQLFPPLPILLTTVSFSFTRCTRRENTLLYGILDRV